MVRTQNGSPTNRGLGFIKLCAFLSLSVFLPLLLCLSHSVSSVIVRLGSSSCLCLCFSFHGHWVVGTCSAKEGVVLAVVGERLRHQWQQGVVEIVAVLF